MSKLLQQSRAYAELIEYARRLRELQTDAEQLLWMMLRNRRFLGLKFRRQRPIPPYIVDFYCDELKLVIELDGGQHNTTDSRRYDENRSRFLKSKGIDILRYWNHEVLGDLECVIEAIALHVDEVKKTSESMKCPHPDAAHPPSPQRGEG